jgi:hypothetical protein
MPSNVNDSKDPFLKGDKSEIPFGLDWASMEAEIFAKMETIQAARARKKKRRFFGFLFLTLVTLASGTLLLLISSKGEGSVPENALNSQGFHASDDSLNALRKHEDLASHPRELQIMPNEAPQVLSSPRQTGNPSAQKTVQKAFEAVNTAKQPSSLTAAVIGSKPTQEPTTGPPAHTRMEAIDDSTTLAVDFQNPLLKSPQQGDSSLLKTPKVSVPPSRNLLPKFGLDFGPSTWGNASNPKDWNNQTYLQSQSSFQVQGYYQKPLGRSTFILGSIQYQVLNSRLSYRKTLYNYPLILGDTVVAIHRNLVTGQMEKLYGNVNTLTTAERIVIHHNTTNLVSFTLGYGTSWQFQKIWGDIYAGLAVNRITHHTGRVVYMDEIVDLTGPENPLIQTSSMTSMIAGTRLHYPLGAHFSLTSNLHLQQALINWSTSAMPALYPFVAALNLGVSYTT